MDLAARACDLSQPSLQDLDPVGPGQIVFYLVSGVSAGVEGGLGGDSAGHPRSNDNSCP